MTRSPPLRQIIPIFLWLKIKELWYLWIVLFLAPIYRFTIFASANESVAAWIGCFILASITPMILGLLGLIAWQGYILISDWLRSNWQQATKIAKAREKGR